MALWEHGWEPLGNPLGTPWEPQGVKCNAASPWMERSEMSPRENYPLRWTPPVFTWDSATPPQIISNKVFFNSTWYNAWPLQST
ncbi:hypothetical protein CONCODRAFT_20923 [Conidiobolus coronatus NRRL 28638]|uniref:Uncharacterized protein n=1 Tax=Conidiobolus coronatus (strain ATCC 28846 / CBS 209.66 / NRRL 28638) TaxID=796925 RepID=A0A137NQK3_CONC2|nr:hypothetical protein CONCODRAFT_20923 [Conidiobolus coronatus NRRL 28638]|eukprot:KXN65046.1 hypothetical protein CONCODRAFT_20923 [Conidiobolus coronatus NRRL 28638]